MDLQPNDYIVYCWRYEADTFAKIGISKASYFWKRVTRAQTHDYRDVELLGVQKCIDKNSALALESNLLNDKLVRHRPDREWIYLEKKAWDWLGALPERFTLRDFKQLSDSNATDSGSTL